MEGKPIEVEYVWRQADVRALRRSLWVRSSRVRLWGALFVASVLLGVFLQAVFLLISIILGMMLIGTLFGLVWPWNPLVVEPRIGLRINDRGIATIRSEGESRGEALVAWSDIGEVRELPREILIVGANERIGELYIPRRAFDEHPEALAELRRRVDAADGVGDRVESSRLEDGGDAGAAGALGTQ